MTTAWLGTLRLDHLVRSHECCETGYEGVRLNGGKRMHTIFSASHYSGGNNEGAVLVFSEKA